MTKTFNVQAERERKRRKQQGTCTRRSPESEGRDKLEAVMHKQMEDERHEEILSKRWFVFDIRFRKHGRRRKSHLMEETTEKKERLQQRMEVMDHVT